MYSTDSFHFWIIYLLNIYSVYIYSILVYYCTVYCTVYIISIYNILYWYNSPSLFILSCNYYNQSQLITFYDRSYFYFPHSLQVIYFYVSIQYPNTINLPPGAILKYRYIKRNKILWMNPTVLPFYRDAPTTHVIGL